MIFSANVAGVDGRGREGQKLFQWPRRTVSWQCFAWAVRQDNTQTYTNPSRHSVATGTYKALCGIIHEAQLEALLVLKGLRQGVTQVVRGQGSLPTVLELGENTLKKRARTCLHPDNGKLCLQKAFVSHLPLNAQSEYESRRSTHSCWQTGAARLL